MPIATTKNPTKTKVLLSLTIEQKELISQLASAKGLSLSAYLRLKALEDVSKLSDATTSTIGTVEKYLKQNRQIPKKYKEYKNFKDFHKQNYSV